MENTSESSTKRGKVRSGRIPAESIYGYVQALRAEYSKPDGMKSIMWKPKQAVTAAGEDRTISPAIGMQPQEFSDADMAAFGSDLEAALIGTDSWARNEHNALVGRGRSDLLTTEQRSARLAGRLRITSA